jgi:hypothetical protein
MNPPSAVKKPVTELSRAIVQAVVYADLFDFPIRIDELWRQLPLLKASQRDVDDATTNDLFVNAHVTRSGELLHLHGREWLIEHRRKQEARTDELVDQHLGILQLLANLPWVRMVAFSGGTSRKNSVGDDDIDLFIVTAPGRAWAVHALMVASSRAMGCREILCANYIVDEDHVTVPDRGDLFTGHEMAALRPLTGEDVLQRLYASNTWVDDLLPNATPNEREQLWAVSKHTEYARKWLERGLWPAGLLLERASRLVFTARIKAKADRSGNSDVLLRPGLLKLHTTDNRRRVVNRFQESLECLGLWSDGLSARMPTRKRT